MVFLYGYLEKNDGVKVFSCEICGCWALTKCLACYFLV